MIDHPNGLAYAAVQWCSSASLLSADELDRLQDTLHRLAVAHDEEDARALHRFAEVARIYLKCAQQKD